jgi:hypothetical protein
MKKLANKITTEQSVSLVCLFPEITRLSACQLVAIKIAASLEPSGIVMPPSNYKEIAGKPDNT